MKLNQLIVRARAGLRAARLPWRNLALATVLATGCASNPVANVDSTAEFTASKPPAFLVGSASALLINTNGFSARLDLVSSSSNEPARPQSARLLGLGSRLLYAPTGSDRVFLWDVVQRRGYVMSEIMQGYAPLATPGQITNILSSGEPPAGALGKLNGHPGYESEVDVLLSDGTTDKFSVWCANDLDGFPVRIKSQAAAAPFRLEILDLRPEHLTPKLFLPPEDFTKYASAEALTSELLVRKANEHNVKKEVRKDQIPMPTPGIHH